MLAKHSSNTVEFVAHTLLKIMIIENHKIVLSVLFYRMCVFLRVEKDQLQKLLYVSCIYMGYI